MARENEVTTVRQLEGEHLGAGRTLHLNSTFSGKYEGARGAVQNGSMLAQRLVAQQRRQIASADHRRRVGAVHQAPTRCLQCHLDLGSLWLFWPTPSTSSARFSFWLWIWLLTWEAICNIVPSPTRLS